MHDNAINCIEVIDKEQRKEGKCIKRTKGSGWYSQGSQCSHNAKVAGYCGFHAGRIWERERKILHKHFVPIPMQEDRFEKMLPILKVLKRHYDPTGKFLKFEEKEMLQRSFDNVIDVLLLNKNRYYKAPYVEEFLNNEYKNDWGEYDILESHSWEQLGLTQKRSDEMKENLTEILRLVDKHNEMVRKLKLPRSLRNVDNPYEELKC